MSCREWCLWALRHWSYNFRDELIGVSISHIAAMSGKSRQAIYVAMKKLEREGRACKARKDTNWYPSTPRFNEGRVMFPMLADE